MVLCNDDCEDGDVVVTIEPYRGPTNLAPLLDEQAPLPMTQLKDTPDERSLEMMPSASLTDMRRRQMLRQPDDKDDGLAMLAVFSRMPVFIAAFMTFYAIYQLSNKFVDARQAGQMVLGPLVVAVFGLLIAIIYLLIGQHNPQRAERWDGAIVAGLDLLVIIICLVVLMGWWVP